MDVFDNPPELMSLASTLLLMLWSMQQALQECTEEDVADGHDNDFNLLPDISLTRPVDIDMITSAALHSFTLWNNLDILDGDLGYWVKPRSTTWFSRFLLEQYDNNRWVKMFRMTKSSVFSLANLLQPTIMKKDTTYRLAILVVVRLCCTLFKLTHGASLLICSEIFAVGRSSVSMLLREVVNAINVVLRSEIHWPWGDTLQQVEADFRLLCGLPGVVGAIDGTHISISKPCFGSADYFYFKSGGYTLNCQAVVDSQKRFLDLFLGMPGSTNDARVLRRSTLFNKASHGTLWDGRLQFNGFTPYLVGDAGYPLLPWLMTPHREYTNMAVAESLFNKKQRRARGTVENAFALLKQTFRELQVKSDLHIIFLPDVITCCGILHNILLRQLHAEVERLLDILNNESFVEVSEEELPQPQCVDTMTEDCGFQEAMDK